MGTSAEIKQRASALAEKTDVNSITPKEVGGIMYDLASHGENVLRNGGTLGIRKVYESVAAMEADSTNPKDFWGDPIKKGNLVVIYDGTTTGVDNNKIYAFMKPGWQFATRLDAAYANKAETDERFFELDKIVNPLSITVSGGGLFEFGTTQNITVKWTTTKSGVAVTPEESLVNGESVTGTSKSFTVSETTRFSVRTTYKREVAEGSTTATFIAAMRFGFNTASTITESIVSSFAKQSLKTSPNGTYTLTATSNGYMWLCVPVSMIINKVTMSGFEVPMEAASTITVGGVNYKCYRSSNQLVSGTYTIVVS